MHAYELDTENTVLGKSVTQHSHKHCSHLGLWTDATLSMNMNQQTCNYFSEFPKPSVRLKVLSHQMGYMGKFLFVDDLSCLLEYVTGTLLFCSFLNLQCPEQCLALSRFSVFVTEFNEWIIGFYVWAGSHLSLFSDTKYTLSPSPMVNSTISG